MSRLLRFLGVQAGEEPLAAGLFTYSFLLGIGRVFVLTSSQALFLQFYPASDLAYVYMIAAVATIILSGGYLRLGRALSARDLIVVNLAFTLATTLAIRMLFGATTAGWPAMALAAWFHSMFALSSFAFWGAATQLVDIRQGKRLFPIATTGDVLAFSLGGLLILRTVDRLGTANLLWIGAAGFALAILAFQYTLSRSATDLSAKPRAEGRRRDAREVRWSSSYLRLMTTYFFLSAAVFVFLDNAFADVAQRRFEGAEDLARFFATYSALAAIVNFTFRSLAAGRLVRRFGLILGLVILPAAVGIGSLSVGLSGTLLPGLGFVFWLTVATRLSDKVLRGVQYSSMATLYQPLGARGPAVQTTMDGIVDAAAIGLSGLALFGLHNLFEIGAVQLAFMLVGFCAVWAGVAVALKREFVRVLGGALHRRRLGRAGIDFVDADILEVVQAQLQSEHAEEVVYALGLLADAEHPGLASALEDLLEHPSEEVRIQALLHIERLEVRADADLLARIAGDSEASTALRGAALRALAQASDEIPAVLLEALESDAPAVRRGAMVGLLRSGSIEGVVYAGAALLDDLGSEKADARMAAADVLRDAAIPNFFQQGVRLLRDEDRDVRAHAVEASAAMNHPGLWPLIVETLRDPDLAPVASEALLRARTTAVPALLEGFRRDPHDRTFRLAALRIIGLTGGEDALAGLTPILGLPDRQERTAVLTALARQEATGADLADAMEGQLRSELGEAAETFAAMADLADLVPTGASPLGHGAEVATAAAALHGALEEELHGTRQRVFLILSRLRPAGELMTAWENYATGTPARRAYALELLDSHLTSEERRQIFPVLEDVPAEDRLHSLERIGPIERLDAPELAERLSRRDELSSWTRLCAQRLGASLGASVEILDESGERLFDQIDRLRHVELFKELSGAVLAGMVPKLRVVEVASGEAVIRQGEQGDSMYVIMDGRVRVHDEERELAVLEGGNVFGEFTVLQSAPRTASVTAVDATQLLRFDQTHLHELMVEHVDVARSLIRVILRRLRSNLAARATAG